VSRKIIFPVLLIACASFLAWSNPNQSVPQDSATFDPDGTAHITRTVPVPTTISPEAQKWLASLAQSTPGPEDLATRRKRTDEWRVGQSAEARRLFPVNVEETTTASVRTDVITPLSTPESNRNLVLINLHGGGFNSDSGSLIEGVPICNLAKIKVVSVYYRLAPENPFPAPVDDTVAVYKALLKTYKPEPAALGLFSVLADYSRTPDSHQLFALNGFPGNLKPQDPSAPTGEEYARNADRKDPVLSPIFADLKNMPPSLLVTSTRDLLLSDTTLFHRALLRSGNDAQLVVFEALPHAFWYHFQLPETTEALNLMSNFFTKNLGH
jgi:monoterpene epsilon-lactone hydrolase